MRPQTATVCIVYVPRGALKNRDLFAEWSMHTGLMLKRRHLSVDHATGRSTIAKRAHGDQRPKIAAYTLR